jgi:RNA polymerase sigma-70 factor (ECF subfamily)
MSGRRRSDSRSDAAGTGSTRAGARAVGRGEDPAGAGSGERELIDLLRGGDSDAWRMFIDRYRRLIYSAINRANVRFGAGWDEDSMEEIFEEVLFRLLRRRGQALAAWQGRCKLETWIFRIVRNLCIDYLRKEGRRAAREEPAEETTSGVHVERGRDLRISLEQAIESALSPREAVAIRLIYFEGYTYREVAERFGVSTGAMSGLVYRALAKLRSDGGLEHSDEKR